MLQSSQGLRERKRRSPWLFLLEWTGPFCGQWVVTRESTMKLHNPATLGAALMIVSVATLTAQDQSKSMQQDPPKPPTTLELTGCVSVNPAAGGQYGFIDTASGGTYRLNGKNLKKYAGQRVRLVGDASTKRLKFKTGLWPSPNIAAQAGALDPAQESIARHSGGAANLPDGTPELKVVRVHGVVDGACQ